MNQLIARLLHRVAHAGADLDLRAQEFGADLAAQGLLAFGEQFRRLLVREVAAVLVDEEVLLLDADGEARFLDRHGSYRATFTAAKVGLALRDMCHAQGGQAMNPPAKPRFRQSFISRSLSRRAVGWPPAGAQIAGAPSRSSRRRSTPPCPSSNRSRSSSQPSR